MRITKENIVRKTVTITPEEIRDFRSRWISYRVCVGLLGKLAREGKMSKNTYRKAVRVIGKRLGFNRWSIFYVL